MGLRIEMAAPKVSIVIPVFNRLDLTRQCLAAIAAVTPSPSYEVIVVDNASTDGTDAFLRAEEVAGRLRCVINPANAGFGRACNQGVGLARGELVLLLNNDTIPQPGWLDALVAAVADPAVGIAGSRLLYPDGRIQHAGIVWNAQGRLDHVHRGAPADDAAVLVPRDFAAVTGACLLIRKELFDEVGRFDDAYHMYVEDVDLCLRVWEAGYRVTYCPASVVIHLENASVTDVGWRDEHVLAGWSRLEERWFGRWPRAVARLAWPVPLPGGPKHFAALAYADDLFAHPELVREWAHTLTPEEATLVIFGAGFDAASLGEKVSALFASVGLGADGEGLEVLALAVPAGTEPPPQVLAAVSAVVATARPSGAAAALPHARPGELERLRGAVVLAA